MDFEVAGFEKKRLQFVLHRRLLSSGNKRDAGNQRDRIDKRFGKGKETIEKGDLAVSQWTG